MYHAICMTVECRLPPNKQSVKQIANPYRKTTLLFLLLNLTRNIRVAERIAHGGYFRKKKLFKDVSIIYL